MSRRNRIPKKLSEKFADLDAHLFVVREHMRKLGESGSHLKVLSTELRTLLCYSSGTEGLLWRLVEELDINDEIHLHVPGDLNTKHPLAQGLQFLIIPIQRGGKGDPRLPPKDYSFKTIIKERQALVVGGKPFTHEYLIKAIAQQMGSAHEDDGLEQMLVDLKSMFINGVEPYIPIIQLDAEFALEIGERVLEYAEKSIKYKRHHHSHDYGNLSLVASIRVKTKIAGRVPLYQFDSNIGNIKILVTAVPTGIEFSIIKHHDKVCELVAGYPEDFVPCQHSVFIFSYCSRSKQARTLVDGLASSITNFKDVGWCHASDFVPEPIEVNKEKVESLYVLTYEKLLSSEDSKGLYELPPSGYGLWKYSQELEERGVFPE